MIKKYVELNDKVQRLQCELSDAEWELKTMLDEIKAGVTRSGSNGDDESWENWWVFSGTKTDDEIEKAMADLGVGGHYNGAGQSYSHDYSYYRRGSRVLVSQMGGLDV